MSAEGSTGLTDIGVTRGAEWPADILAEGPAEAAAAELPEASVERVSLESYS